MKNKMGGRFGVSVPRTKMRTSLDAGVCGSSAGRTFVALIRQIQPLATGTKTPGQALSLQQENDADKARQANISAGPPKGTRGVR